MKQIFFSLATLAVMGCTYTAHAQVKLGATAGAPDGSAILEMESTVKGFLPPRMSTSQRDLIASPAVGLVIFNTDTKALEVNTGTTIAPVWSSAKAGNTASTVLTSSSSPAGTSQGQMMYNTGSVQPTGLVYWDGSQWKSVASSGGNTTNNYTIVNNKTVTNNDSVINNNPVVNNDTLINNGPVYNTTNVTNAGNVTNDGPVTNNNTSTFNGTSTFNNTSTFNKKAVFGDSVVMNGTIQVGGRPQGLTTDSVLVFEPTTKVMRRLAVSEIAGKTTSTVLTSSSSPAGTTTGQMMYNTGSVQPTGLVYWDGSEWKSVASSGGNTTNNYTVVNNETVTNNDSVINNNPVVNNDTLINNGQVFNNSTVTNAGAVTNNSTSTFNGTSTFNNTSTFNKKAVFNDTAVFSGGMKVSNLPQGAVTDSILVFEPTTKVMRRISVTNAAAAGEPWYKVGTTSGATSNTDNVYLNGNVGIGTNTPLAPLHVSSTGAYGINIERTAAAAAAPRLHFYKNNGTTIGTPEAVTNGSTLGAIDFYAHNGTSYPGIGSANASIISYATEDQTASARGTNLVFRTNSNGSASSAERMRIDQNGNVGIGTTTPDASALLDITSTGKGFLPPRMTSTQRDAISNPAKGLMIFNTTTNAQETNTGTPTTPVWSSAATISAAGEPWYKVGTTSGATANTDDVYLNGKVGIGTSAPDAKLHISGDASSDFKNSTIYSTNTGTDGHTWSFGARPRGTAGDFAISDETNSVTRMTIQGGTGNVGIGTISPAQKLDVTGNLALRNSSVAGGNKHISIQNSAGLDRWAMGMAVAEPGSGNAGGNFYLWNYDDNGTFLGNPLIINRASGNVAIGTGGTNARLSIGGATASTATNIDPLIDVYATDGAIAGLYHSNNGTQSYIGLTSQNANGSGQAPIVLNQWGGNVGIGTATPSANLEVGSASDAIINITSAGSIYQTSLDYITNGIKRWRLINTPSNDFSIFDQDGAAERLRIDGTTGNVSIGSSQTGAKLNIGGTTASTSTSLDVLINVAATDGNIGSFYHGNNGTDSYLGLTATDAAVTKHTPIVLNQWGGNVGIGTATPASKLDVNGNLILRGSALAGGNRNVTLASDAGVARWVMGMGVAETGSGNAGGNFYLWNYADNGDFLGSPFIVERATGYIGINNGAPKAPLHIGGTTSASYTPSAFTYLSYASGAVLTNPGGSARTDASLITEGNIWSKAVIASVQTMTFSDKRIKNIIGQSDATKDLDLLNKIRVTDYRMKDVVKHGNQQYKKVIAQEVEAIYPEAVTQQTGFVPNIYQLADKVQSMGNNTYKASFKNKVEYNNNVTGDLKLYDEQKEITAKVVSKGDNEIVFTTTEEMKGDKLFLFGEEVTDFRAVDYEALSTLNISATQELYREIQELKKKNAELTASMENSYTELAAQVKALQAALNVSATQTNAVAGK